MQCLAQFLLCLFQLVTRPLAWLRPQVTHLFYTSKFRLTHPSRLDCRGNVKKIYIYITNGKGVELVLSGYLCDVLFAALFPGLGALCFLEAECLYWWLWCGVAANLSICYQTSYASDCTGFRLLFQAMALELVAQVDSPAGGFLCVPSGDGWVINCVQCQRSPGLRPGCHALSDMSAV